MMLFEWNGEKNDRLKRERDISFEDILLAIDEGRVLANISNPSKKFPHQKMLIVEIGMRAYCAPYVPTGNTIGFFKTIYPSRKYTKRYLQDI